MAAACNAEADAFPPPMYADPPPIYPPPLAKPDIGTAALFTVHSSNAVTNTGFTTVGGCYGTAGTSMTGTEGLVEFSALPVIQGFELTTTRAQSAWSDIKIANDYVAGLVGGELINHVNIGGETYYPGLYTAAGALEVSGSDLTLSGDGVFIFQTPSTLMVASGIKMTLSNGAQACNVFWQVGSNAVFYPMSETVGNVLAAAGIAMQSGAKVTGRVFGLNAAVTLISNKIVFPFADESM
eukprot:gene12731-15977_t